MQLLQAKERKDRYTYKLDDRIRKIWYGPTPSLHFKVDSLQEYIDIMNKIMPGYILDYGETTDGAYIDFKFIPGTNLLSHKHTKEFVNKFREFCINSIRDTYPYSHGDWILPNVIEHNGEWSLIDWDNVFLRTPAETRRRLNVNLKETFGYNVDIVTKRELYFMEKH
tara:strand:+ start:139 stop:639 length:501 start_codon:yes stop_codon:yes gene_type:complete